MKTAFWKADWFFGLVVVIALFGFARMSGFIPGLERWAYDQGVRMTSKSPLILKVLMREAGQGAVVASEHDILDGICLSIRP